MLRIFQVAQKHDLDIHPETLRAVTRNLKHVDKALRENPKASALFIEMLTSEKDPETTLRRLNEAGVLGRFLPDFGRVVAQMQYNMYHHYTVDEHTIRSEEHTSELQSLMRISYAVFCLEKKNRTQHTIPKTENIQHKLKEKI